MRQLKSRSRQRGQALVEGALTLIVYLALLLGTMELAQTMFLFQTYSDRARHALRMVCIEAYDPATTEAKLQNWVLYGQPTVPAGASSSSGYLGLQRSSIQLIADLPDNENNRLTVRISNYSFSLFTGLLVGATTGSSSGRTIEYSHPYELPL
ncbi:MAG TPA: TadE family protein [Bryobacteraceae bacterium]|nr:TadE family protein [Bryobacteraceae bacterium]